jgi:hypothetical protein
MYTLPMILLGVVYVAQPITAFIGGVVAVASVRQDYDRDGLRRAAYWGGIPWLTWISMVVGALLPSRLRSAGRCALVSPLTTTVRNDGVVSLARPVHASVVNAVFALCVVGGVDALRAQDRCAFDPAASGVALVNRAWERRATPSWRGTLIERQRPDDARLIVELGQGTPEARDGRWS